MIITSILVALSLCADCFAVSLVTGLTLSGAGRRKILAVALLFAVIQTGLLLGGFFLGEVIADFVWRISKILAFGLLAFVGGSMLLEGIKGESGALNLSGLGPMIVAGVATSIDALSVGAAEAFAGHGFRDIVPLAISVAVITAISVIVGLLGARILSSRWGRTAEIIGGLVLITIGVLQLF